MIDLHSRPAVDPDPQGGWHLVLWAGEAFDYSTPFRGVLANIAEILGKEAPTSIDLPAYKDGEDFVEGVIQFGDAPIRIYYEHSLSYLALMSDSEKILRRVAECLEPHMAVA